MKQQLHHPLTVVQAIGVLVQTCSWPCLQSDTAVRSWRSPLCIYPFLSFHLMRSPTDEALPFSLPPSLFLAVSLCGVPPALGLLSADVSKFSPAMRQANALQQGLRMAALDMNILNLIDYRPSDYEPPVHRLPGTRPVPPCPSGWWSPTPTTCAQGQASSCHQTTNHPRYLIHLSISTSNSNLLTRVAAVSQHKAAPLANRDATRRLVAASAAILPVLIKAADLG